MKSYLFTAVISFLFICNNCYSQCAAGKNQFTLDWDQHEFTRRPYSNVTTDQRYQFGGNNNTLTIGYAGGLTTQLDNPYHTIYAGSLGSAGDNVQFTGNGTITFTFTTEVDNLTFSLYDVDGGEAANFSAKDAANNSKTIILSTAGTTNLTLNNNPGINAYANSNATLVSPTDAATAPNNTLNVSITGPVKTVVITLSNAAAEEIWLSDITACIPVYNFPANNLNITKPNTGIAQYILAADINKVNYVDVTTGFATLLFQDTSTAGINNLALDAYNAIIYFTDNRVIASNKTIKKYNIRTGVTSVFVADVNTIGIPTQGEGIGSGGAAFYNGSLFFSGDPETTADSVDDVVWRIDLDNAGNALPAIEVRSFNTGSGADIHNWGDMGIVNGKVFDFNMDNTGANGFTSQRFNMNTGATDLFALGGNGPWQMGVGWDNKIYSVSSEIRVFDTLSGTLPAAGSGIAMNGNWVAGHIAYDATEMFKMPADYGSLDPAKYEDPNLVIQGNHLFSANLYLGDLSPDVETYNSGVPDGPEDDGIIAGAVPLYSSSTTYIIPVKVFNNTGSTATMSGFIDFNNDGDFTDAGEKVSVSVPSSATVQIISLPFTGFASPVTGTSVGFRIRLSSDASKIQTIFDGAPDGELEDYTLTVLSTLKVGIIKFSAEKFEKNKAKISWQIADETGVQKYILERSSNGIDFSAVYSYNLPANNSATNKEYFFIDNTPLSNANYYRLKIIENNNVSYSEVRLLNFDAVSPAITAFPNPVKRGQYLHLKYPADKKIKEVSLINELGEKVLSILQLNSEKISTNNLPAGFYKLLIIFADGKKEHVSISIIE